MTTVDDVHRLISKTTTDSLTWVVAGLPVVACFPSKSDAELSEFLGMTTGRNDHEEDLQLWVALDQVSHQLFVTLTIRIKASTNRKPNRRLLYLVVPAEGLLLRSLAADYDSLNLPQDLFEIPHDVPSMKHKMLHMTFESTSEPSYVVMQSYPNPPNLGFQAEILLRKLRHLSEASAFGLYANHAQDRQCALELACDMSLSDTKPVTPKICIQGLYPGGRPGCINNWKSQGLRAVPPTTHKISRQAPVSAFQSPSAPPPYSRAGSSETPRVASAAPSAASQDLPCLPTCITSTPLQDSSRLHDNAAVAAAFPSVRYSVGPDAGSYVPETSWIFSSTDSPVPHTRESSLSTGYTATFLSSGFRRNHNSAVQVAASPLDINTASHDRHNTPARTSDGISGSMRKRQASAPSDPQHGSVKRVANPSSVQVGDLEVWSQQLPATLADPAADPSSTIIGPSFDPAAEIGRSRTSAAMPESSHVSRWLRKAWEVCPSAHYTFIAELMRLCSATEPDEITTCSVNCTLALLRQGFRERLTQTGFELADVARRQLGKDTMALVSWLYTLEPGTDIDFHEDLIKLALLEDQLIGPFDKAAEYDHVRVSFLCRKADIVTVACTRFGKELSEQAGIDVVARMLRMRDRLEMVGGNF
jgi:hypothetical protein